MRPHRSERPDGIGRTALCSISQTPHRAKCPPESIVVSPTAQNNINLHSPTLEKSSVYLAIISPNRSKELKMDVCDPALVRQQPPSHGLAAVV